jgi:hypothetical protein
METRWAGTLAPTVNESCLRTVFAKLKEDRPAGDVDKHAVENIKMKLKQSRVQTFCLDSCDSDEGRATER